MTGQIIKILIFYTISLSVVVLGKSTNTFSQTITSSEPEIYKSRDINDLSLDACLQYFIKNGYMQDYTLRRLFSFNKYDPTKREDNKLYIGLQLNDSLSLKIGKKERKSRFVIFDYENKSITDLGFTEPGFYLSNISDMIAYQTAPDKKPKVIILHKGEKGDITKREIENALFPSLSNKRELCYSQIKGYTNDGLPNTKLILQKLDSGKVKTIDSVIPYFVGNKEINYTPDIGILLPDFSPFGGLIFVSYTISGGIFKISIMIDSNSDIAAHQMLHDDIGPMSLFPYNCSGDIRGVDLIFQSRKTFSGNNFGNTMYLKANSPEITAYVNFESFQSQRTSNNIAEWHARIYNSGCFYIESPGGDLFYNNRKINEIKPIYFEIWNNLFIYAEKNKSSDAIAIKVIKVSDLSSGLINKGINITENIQQQLGSK